MPRDLGLEDLPVLLTESPNSTDQGVEQHPTSAVVRRAEQQPRTLRTLHPYTSPLTTSDVESCVALENAAFQVERERCSREKFIYRLSKCGELSLGLFCTATPDSDIPAETLKTGRPVETSRKDGAIAVLLAHIIATRSKDEVVTDKSMDYPLDWDSLHPAGTTTVGHQEDGRTICLHSLAVLPSYQDKGLGRTIMMAYMQQMNGAGIADRIALIAHDYMVEFYEKLGFKNKGPSEAQFGGGGWIDMVFELKSLDARAIYG